MGATDVTHRRHEDCLEMKDGEWPADGQRRNAQPEEQGGGLELGQGRRRDVQHEVRIGGRGECPVPPQVDGGLW